MNERNEKDATCKVSIAEAAEALGVSTRAIYLRIGGHGPDAPKLPAERIGSKLIDVFAYFPQPLKTSEPASSLDCARCAGRPGRRITATGSRRQCGRQ